MLRLTGNMDGYRWSFNNQPLSVADRILISRGERIRFVLKNETMMNHPMHLHGHFFRVITDEKDFSPIKHTVNVPSMETVVIEFDADEEKDWFFHCHNLYHMKAGMSRVVRYDDFQGDPNLPSTLGALYVLKITATGPLLTWGCFQAKQSSRHGDLTIGTNGL